MNTFFQGFALQASLILALGAQNLFVIESGLEKRNHLMVASICSICDFILIFVGVLGVSSFFLNYPMMKIGIGAVGVLFLLYYAIQKLFEGFSSNSISHSKSTQFGSKKEIIMATLGFTLLNPHVYLDTIVLIGGYSTQYDFSSSRYLFGLGAGSFSILWFFALAFFSSTLSGLLSSERAMKMISLISGLILGYLSIKLGNEVFVWIQRM